MGVGFLLRFRYFFFMIHKLHWLRFLPVSAASLILASARHSSTGIFLLLLLLLLLDLLLSLFGFGLGLTLIFDALKISFILLKPLLSFLFGRWNWL